MKYLQHLGRGLLLALAACGSKAPAAEPIAAPAPLEATPTDPSQMGTAECPHVQAYAEAYAGAAGAFSAEIHGGPTGVSATYAWTVSAGAIASGQGTPSITVDAAGLAGQSVTATVAVGGYDPTCTMSTSAATAAFP